MRIALGQFNATVGDLAGNVAAMKTCWDQAMLACADLVVFPELAVCGYPPEDLLHQRHFLVANRSAVERLAAACPKKTIIVGFAESVEERVFNSAAVIRDGRITEVYRKGRLPNFSVFDESRYFESGSDALVVRIGDLSIGLTICYDLWDLRWLKQRFQAADRMELILNISASPFDMGKITRRLDLIGRCARQFGCAVAYCNLVGGQDELVFDGRSLVADSTGRIVQSARAFDRDLCIADVVRRSDGHVEVRCVTESAPAVDDPLEEVYHALVLGTRDYCRKNGFQKVLLGVSGGIDSAVTAALAVAAVGRENVMCMTMPSMFNCPETISDAGMVAKNLGVDLRTIPIQSIVDSFHGQLSSVHGWDNKGLAYENLQARVRGIILMSLSNQMGAMVLTTGNKSEVSVGYATLYGDMAGGFAVIKDVPKTLVYKLASLINRKAGRPVIPSDTITRPPTAELRPDQKDSDSLPEYDLLDRIIRGYVELDKSIAELIQEGLPAQVVRKVVRMIDLNEYKRRQSPPGVRITAKAFGKDRRLPITNRYNPSDPLP